MRAARKGIAARGTAKQLKADTDGETGRDGVKQLEVWSHAGEDSWCSACRRREVPTVLMGLQSKYFGLCFVCIDRMHAERMAAR